MAVAEGSPPDRTRLTGQPAKYSVAALVNWRSIWHDWAMTISSHTERLSKAKARLERAEALVVSDREVLSGEPCIRGTRVPVYLIGALAHAQGVRKTHAAYPFLTVEQIELVSLYVSEHPRKDRPRQTRLPKPYSTKRGRTPIVRL